jgi:DNA polymerase IV (DinB-like DNA polymerase)
MPISLAYKLCPNGIFVHGSHSNYRNVSEDVMNILKTYSEEFQPASIDEAYLDLTGICDNFDSAYKLAEKLKAEIKTTIGITCSVGIASTKSIAKIATDYNKPDGITVVEQDIDSIKLFLKTLEITRISGIGKKSKKYYYAKGIKKIGDFYKIGYNKTVKWFGKHGEWIWKVINGLDDRPVKEFHKRKSFGKERTFFEDRPINEIISKLRELNERIHEKLDEKNIMYKTITLKIRFQGYETYTRAKSFQSSIKDKEKSFLVIKQLLNTFSEKKKKVRLVGIRFSSLEKSNGINQQTLFQCIPSLKI